ncbi:MAG: oligosaccharide repeat unit polymerase [Thermoleophilia bacterium]|nr:oligosaccharide repeat unit polymerase [Thermoleophilia bacterium]
MREFGRLNQSLLSPLVAFCAAWLLGAVVSQYHLLAAQSDWSDDMLMVVLAVPIAFFAGGLIGEGAALRLAGTKAEPAELAPSTLLLRRILVVFLVLGLLELAHQFVKIGGIPLLSPEGNTLRFDQGGPTIVLTDLLTVAAIVALVKPRNPLARESRFELAVAVIALTGFALQAGRGSIILPVVVATAARWLYWGRPRAPVLSAAALLTFLAVVFGFYLRTRQNPYNPFEAELYGEVLPDIPFFLQPLVPLHLAISTNFLALQGLVSYFPTSAPFAGGAFDAVGLNNIFSGARNVSDVSAGLTPPWVTSTVAGPLWADGGFAALVPGVAMTGFASAGAFAMSRRTRSLRWSMIAGYLLFLALFGIYTNLWTQQIDWLLVVPLLLAVGAIAEDPASPPGLTGWAWVRIRRMIGRGDNNPERAERSRRPLGRKSRLAIGLASIGLGILVVLAVSGLAIQRLIPEPYPLFSTIRLPDSVEGAAAILTDSDLPQDNEQLRWVVPAAGSVHVYSLQPAAAAKTTRRSPAIADPGAPGTTAYDVGKRADWRSMALFAFQERGSSLSIRISPTAVGEAPPVDVLVPNSAAPTGATRDLMVATWNGTVPDLFVLTRGRPNSRPVLEIRSGESDFRAQLFITRLPFRGLETEQWSVDVGQISTLPRDSDGRTVKGTRPDLLLVHHDPAKEHSDVHVLLGESGFQWEAFQRDLDGPGSVPAGTAFVLGSTLGATAVYEVQRQGPSGPQLKVFGLTSPAGFR